MASNDSDLWRHLDSLIDRAPSDDDIRSHRLEVPAARRFRAAGRVVPEDFAAQERLAAIRLLTAPLVIDRVRNAYDGRLLLIKGVEVAAHYADAGARLFGDIDLLADDAPAVQRALLAAGFVEVGDPDLYHDIHHLRPLAVDGLPLPLEVHSRPKWIEPLTPPSADELLDVAVPSANVEGVLALPPAYHAVLLAVHSWAHEPLRRLRDVVDVAAVAAHADPAEMDRIASSWGVRRLWRTTAAAFEALLDGGPRPWTFRLWAQNLHLARERTVFENHVQRWLSDFWVLPTGAALRRLPQTFAFELGPDEEEGWRAKLARTALAFRNASRRRSHHDRQLESRARENSGDQPEGENTTSTQ
jgi:putative nucleotidyltransferase-like protein